MRCQRGNASRGETARACRRLRFPRSRTELRREARLKRWGGALAAAQACIESSSVYFAPNSVDEILHIMYFRMVRRIVYQGTGKIMVAVSNPAWRSDAGTELWLLSKTAETIFPFGVLHATARQTARVPHHLLSHTSRSLHRYPKNFVWLQPKWKCVANLCGWCHGLFQQVKPRS